MPDMDLYNVYTPTGEILQLRYAEKAASSGSTILGMRNKRGAVVVVCKPIDTQLHVKDSNFRIQKLAGNCCIAYTGVLSDGTFLTRVCKHSIDQRKKMFEEEATALVLKETLARYVHMSTSYLGMRALGVDFILGICDRGEYKIILGQTSGEIGEYYAYAAGKGARRAITELEKEDFESMEMLDLVECGVRTLYKSYDPLSESEFTVEAAMISDDSDGKFVRVSKEFIDRFVEKYKHISVDGDPDE